jgi:small subunit ribosomal protein S17
MAEDSVPGDVPADDELRDALSADDAPQDVVSADDAAEDAAPRDEPAPDEAPQDEVTGQTGAEAAPAAAPAAVASREPAPARASERGAGAEEARPNRRKVREGLVVSIKMDKTAVVGVVERVRHPRYAKTVQRTKRLYAHDTQNNLRVGDRVRVAETRPLSKLKRWRVVEVLERAK